MTEDTLTPDVGSTPVFNKDTYRDPIFSYDFLCRPHVGDKIVREDVVYKIEEIRHVQSGIAVGVTKLGELHFGSLI